MFVTFIELVLAIIGVLLILFVVTQVIIPAIKGTHFFPWFRTTETAVKIEEAEKELEKVAEQEQLAAITDELKVRKDKLKGKQ